MIDPEKFTVQYWGALRRHAYRMTGSILDAEDVVQETMLRAVEMGSSLENVADHFEWLHIAATEAAVPRIRNRPSLYRPPLMPPARSESRRLRPERWC